MVKRVFERDEINSYCSLLNEVVKQTIRTIEFGQVKFGEKENEISSLLFMRQMADLADGMMILIEKCSGDSATIILRSLFETDINFRYLELEKTQNSNKFLYFYYRKKLELLSSEISGTRENIDLLEVLKSDEGVHQDTIDFLSSNKNGIETIETLNELLSKPIYKDVNEYYLNSKKENRKHWYSLLNGPRNFYELVKEVKMPAQYKVNYSIWSSLTHSWDIVNKNLHFEDDFTRIKSIRNCDDIDMIAFEAIVILKRAITRYVVNNLLVEFQEFGGWLKSFEEKIGKSFTSSSFKL